MFVDQSAVFVENKTGRLADVMALLGREGVDVKALTVADTADFGIIRLIVNSPEKALTILKDNSFTANITEVLAFSVSDKPGALYSAMEVLRKADVNIKYLYAVTGQSAGNADFVIRVSDNDAAAKALSDGGFALIDKEEIYK